MLKPFDKGLLGQEAEDRWSDLRKADGSTVLRVADLVGNTGERQAPCLIEGVSVYAAPDFLVWRIGAAPGWEEVKGKTRASYRFSSGDWEHGVDLALFESYERAAKASPLLMAIFEQNSPDCPACGRQLVPVNASYQFPDGEKSRCFDCRSKFDAPAFFPSGKFLVMPIAKCRAQGRAAADWPGGKSRPWDRGKDGKGGWLWPRAFMQRVEDEKPKLPPKGQLRLL